MPKLHFQGGPGPANSSCAESELMGTMDRGGEKWEYTGGRDDRPSGSTVFLFKHVALLESRVRFIQRGH